MTLGSHRMQRWTYADLACGGVGDRLQRGFISQIVIRWLRKQGQFGWCTLLNGSPNAWVPGCCTNPQWHNSRVVFKAKLHETMGLLVLMLTLLCNLRYHMTVWSTRCDFKPLKIMTDTPCTCPLQRHQMKSPYSTFKSHNEEFQQRSNQLSVRGRQDKKRNCPTKYQRSPPSPGHPWQCSVCHVLFLRFIVKHVLQERL